YVVAVICAMALIIVNWSIFECLPGHNGAQQFLAGSARIASNPQAVARLCAQWNCHASRYDQFVAYIHNMLTFQLGVSYQNGAPIATQVIQQGRLQNTLVLLGVSTILSIIIGIVLGVVSSSRRASTLDSLSVSASIMTSALTIFWVGLLLIIVFAIGIGWLPSGGLLPASFPIAGPLPSPLPV